MNWKEKMIEGMNLIREACAENDTYEECLNDCPLAELCAHTKVNFHPICWDSWCTELKFHPIYWDSWCKEELKEN